MIIFYIGKLGLFIGSQWNTVDGISVSLIDINLAGEDDVELYLSFTLLGFGFGFSWSMI